MAHVLFALLDEPVICIPVETENQELKVASARFLALTCSAGALEDESVFQQKVHTPILLQKGTTRRDRRTRGCKRAVVRLEMLAQPSRETAEVQGSFSAIES